jgi:hypothetical protein
MDLIWAPPQMGGLATSRRLRRSINGPVAHIDYLVYKQLTNPNIPFPSLPQPPQHRYIRGR